MSITKQEVERISKEYFSSAVTLSRTERFGHSEAIREARRQHRVACVNREKAMAEARADFAESRGWIVSKTPFSLDALRTGKVRTRLGHCTDYRWLDHCEYFLLPDRAPVGVLSHSYGSITEIVANAKAEALNVHILRTSWYWPGGTTALVLTRREVPYRG